MTGARVCAQLAKTATAYRHFLNESIVNYKTLIAKLQATYGDVGVDIQVGLPCQYHAVVQTQDKTVSARRHQICI